MSSSSEAIAKFTNQAQMASYFADRMGIISVKSYRAVGDGIEDDTEAILAALADVVLKGCKSLFFPRGAYKVDPTLITVANFNGIFIWGDNSSFVGISHPINQVGPHLSVITTFLGLTDTPITFAGQAGKLAAVNVNEDALEFVDGFAEITAMLADYYTAIQLNAGQLDSRYYTQAELDADFATKLDLADLILGVIPPGSLDGASILNDTLTTDKMAAEQKRGGALGVASLDANSKVIEEPASKAQADGIASLDAGDFQLILANTALCATPLETLNVPAITAQTWTYCEVALATPANLISVRSIGLKQAVDKGAINIKIDDVRAFKVYAPTYDTYQILKIVVSDDGNTVSYYVDGVLVKTLTASGISPDVPLYATIATNSTTAGASKTVDVDYIHVTHNR